MPVWVVNNNCSLLVVFVAFFDGAAVAGWAVLGRAAARLRLSSGSGFAAHVLALLNRLHIIVIDGSNAELGRLHLRARGRQSLQWVLAHLVDFLPLGRLARVVVRRGADRIRRLTRRHLNAVAFVGAAIFVVGVLLLDDALLVLGFLLDALRDQVAHAVLLPGLHLDRRLLRRAVLRNALCLPSFQIGGFSAGHRLRSGDAHRAEAANGRRRVQVKSVGRHIGRHLYHWRDLSLELGGGGASRHLFNLFFLFFLDGSVVLVGKFIRLADGCSLRRNI